MKKLLMSTFLTFLIVFVAHADETFHRSETVFMDDCATFTDPVRFCQDAAGLRYFFDGTTVQAIQSGVSSTPTIGDVFSAGNTITGATPSNPLILKGSNPAHGSLELYVDPTSGSVEMCKDGSGNPVTCQWRLRPSSDGTIVNGANDTCSTVSSTTGRFTWASTGTCVRPVKTIAFTALALAPDGANCVASTATINSWAATPVIFCADSNSSVMSLWVHMPDSWDAGTIVLKLDWVITDSQASKVLAIDPLFTCSADGAQIAARPAQATTYQMTVTSNTQTNDHNTMVSGAITKSSGTCVAGGMIQLVMYVDATAWTATTPTTTVALVGGAIEYTVVADGD